MGQSDKITVGGLGVALNEVSNIYSDYKLPNHYSDWITLNPGEVADVELSVLFGATGNDVFQIMTKTLDLINEVPQIDYIQGGTILMFEPYALYTKPLVVTNCYKFRIEFRKGGTTAGSYTPNVYLRKNGINI